MLGIKKYKVCRRLGSQIYDKCQTQKFAISEGKKKFSTKGKRPGRQTDYGLQLIEKQKVRFFYGVSEKQFKGYVDKANTIRSKSTPDILLFTLLENRLDNIIYRLGLAKSRRMARQMATHGHFVINGKRTTVPSYQLKEGDVVEVREGSKVKAFFTEVNKEPKVNRIPAWLSWDAKKLQATVKGVPTEADTFLNFQAVIEFYSR